MYFMTYVSLTDFKFVGQVHGQVHFGQVQLLVAGVTFLIVLLLTTFQNNEISSKIIKKEYPPTMNRDSRKKF